MFSDGTLGFKSLREKYIVVGLHFAIYVTLPSASGFPSLSKKNPAWGF